MTDRDEGFLVALQQDPNDDVTRLVYADFLEDQGDEASCARAELIRVQVELAVPTLWTPGVAQRREALTTQQDELLARWEHVWLGDWADRLAGWTYRRGFIEAVRADASHFLAHAAEWFELWPLLTAVKLGRAAGHLHELAESPWLAHLRGLDLSNNGITSETLAPLTQSRYLCLLQAIDLSRNPLGLHGLGRLSAAAVADELREVHVAQCGLNNGWIEDWLCGRAHQWLRLDLSNNRLTRRDLEALVASPILRNLVALDLGSNPIGQGTVTLADSPSASALVDLGLSDTDMSNIELTALASSPHLRSVRSLDLRGHRCWPRFDRQGVDQGGLGELARSPMLGQLRRLLLAARGPSNGWTADVMKLCRPPRRDVVMPEPVAANILRASPYLVPSMLSECDVAELWWLGDTRRERLPSAWDE